MTVRFSNTELQTAAEKAGYDDTVSLELKEATLTVGHADLTAAATNEQIDFAAAMPANAVVLGSYLEITTLFSGGSVSDCTTDIGVSSGDVDAIMAAVPTFTADPTGNINGPKGIALDGHYGGVTLAVNVVTTGDNVVNLSAGSVTAHIFYIDITNI
jgi:hypothetical protein